MSNIQSIANSANAKSEQFHTFLEAAVDKGLALIELLEDGMSELELTEDTDGVSLYRDALQLTMDAKAKASEACTALIADVEATEGVSIQNGGGK